MRTDDHIKVGALAFDGIDQIDLTGPFEVLSRLPNSSFHIYSPDGQPVEDINGLKMVADGSLSSAPALDVLHVPGGPGQEALMADECVLRWLQTQASGALMVLSVCTGALLCGAAGLLRDRRATTHWATAHLLPMFGAKALNQRVVVDGKFVFAAGVTAGIDAALTLASMLRGVDVAQAIQLDMVYAPEPPFDAGTPETAPPDIVARLRESGRGLLQRREATARRVAQRLGITPPD